MVLDAIERMFDRRSEPGPVLAAALEPLVGATPGSSRTVLTVPIGPVPPIAATWTTSSRSRSAPPPRTT